MTNRVRWRRRVRGAVYCQSHGRYRTRRSRQSAPRLRPFVSPVQRKGCAGPVRHFGGGTAGEGQEQDPLRPGPRQDQMGNPMRQCARLTGAGACDDQQRARDVHAPGIQDAVFNRSPLGDIQIAQICRGVHVRRRGPCSSSVPSIVHAKLLSILSVLRIRRRLGCVAASNCDFARFGVLGHCQASAPHSGRQQAAPVEQKHVRIGAVFRNRSAARMQRRRAAALLYPVYWAAARVGVCAAASTAAACLATRVPSKKRGFCVPHNRTALAKVKSRKSSAVMWPSSTSS